MHAKNYQQLASRSLVLIFTCKENTNYQYCFSGRQHPIAATRNRLRVCMSGQPASRKLLHNLWLFIFIEVVDANEFYTKFSYVASWAANTCVVLFSIQSYSVSVQSVRVLSVISTVAGSRFRSAPSIIYAFCSSMWLPWVLPLQLFHLRKRNRNRALK